MPFDTNNKLYVPPYNHSRGDSAVTPCDFCKALSELPAKFGSQLNRLFALQVSHKKGDVGQIPLHIVLQSFIVLMAEMAAFQAAHASDVVVTGEGPSFSGIKLTHHNLGDLGEEPNPNWTPDQRRRFDAGVCYWTYVGSDEVPCIFSLYHDGKHSYEELKVEPKCVEPKYTVTMKEIDDLRIQANELLEEMRKPTQVVRLYLSSMKDKYNSLLAIIDAKLKAYRKEYYRTTGAV